MSTYQFRSHLIYVSQRYALWNVGYSSNSKRVDIDLFMQIRRETENIFFANFYTKADQKIHKSAIKIKTFLLS